MGGIEGLYELCISQAGITMEEIRRLLLFWDFTFGPVKNPIDEATGTYAYARPNFWSKVRLSEPMRTMFQIAIYGELFGSTFQAFLQPELDFQRFNLEMRLDYCRYCIPDRLVRKRILVWNLLRPLGRIPVTLVLFQAIKFSFGNAKDILLEGCSQRSPTCT